MGDVVQIPPRNGEGDQVKLGGGALAASRPNVERARSLRQEMSLPEVVLWQALCSRPHGFKFRRQHPVGAFVADFYCHAIKFIVELDGDTHAGREASDEVRTMLLSRSGHNVARFYNTDVFDHLPEVLEAIYCECERLSTPTPPHPNPLPEGEGTRGAAS